MRLSQLKISGFKSFADTTIFQFHDQRTAIVGPNGCGKSNVIDAIRWVLGESNARQLRGGQMQDVIFAGSHQRKPGSVASVELRFDNAQGRIGGIYQSYREISVRRQVNRDGRSLYFLNGSVCRRRDITELFLGTGLGPRSYAVIEQGMIHRLIEARADEMRTFVEEAAGISRYHARRRETLQHLDQASGNLERLQDIEQELAQQMRRISRQAEQAVRYRELQRQLTEYRQQWLSIQWHQAEQRWQKAHQILTEHQQQFDQYQHQFMQDEQAYLQAQQHLHVQLDEATPLQQAQQQAHQQSEALHWQLQQYQQQQAQCQRTTADASQRQQQILQQQDAHQLQITQRQQQIEQAQQHLADLQQQDQAYYQQFMQIEQQLAREQQQWQQLRQQQQATEAEQRQVRQQSSQLHKTLLRLQDQLQQLESDTSIVAPDPADADDLRLQQAQLEQQQLIAQTQQLQLDQQLATLQATHQQLQLEHQRIALAQQHARQQLQRLDQQALLASHSTRHLSDRDGQQLWQMIELTATGQQHAALIEAWLDDWLQAIVSTDWQDEFLAQLAPTNPSDHFSRTWQGLPHASYWIAAPSHSFWQHLYLCPDLSQALAVQSGLTEGRHLLTSDGYWVGPDWCMQVVAYRQFSRAESVSAVEAKQALPTHQLQDRYQRQNLTEQLDELDHQLTQINAQLNDHVQQMNDAHDQLQQLKKQHMHVQHQLNTTQQALLRHELALQQYEQQQQRIQHSRFQLHHQQQEDQQELDYCQIQLDQLQQQLESLQPQAQALQHQMQDTQQQHQMLKAQRRQQRDALEQQRQQLERLQAQRALAQQQYLFDQQQVLQLDDQIRLQNIQLDELTAHIKTTQHQLQEARQQAVLADLAWQTWQQQLTHAQQQVNHLQQQARQSQAKLHQLRDHLEQARLDVQQADDQRQHVTDQLHEAQLDCLPADAVPKDQQRLSQELAKAQQALDQIPSVNLAAVDELAELQARHQPLLHQIIDLQHGIEQLRQAIADMDAETRQLFVQTFEAINHQLAELFPKIFGGGEAALVLESDWQSGVRLMARPPGKRISTLAQLSGGEKALTALALIFAIFRLNPAPFCVLDEVDAPLDDANVRRFCNLVTELSQQVQFIYITHNKIAMQMATDLMGITMPQAGTSRLVAVRLAADPITE